MKREISPEELKQAWNDLAEKDAGKGYRAMRLLASAPKQTLPFLRERLQLQDAPEKSVIDLIADLDAYRYAVRNKAAKKLLTLQDRAEPVLRQTAGANCRSTWKNG